MHIDEIKKRLIINVRSGSHMVGLDLATSDIDTFGVCIEPIEESIGLNTHFEQDVKTKPDVTYYSLRRYLQLALNGNPTVIQLLYTTERDWIEINQTGRELISLAEKIVSRRAVPAFLGYMEQQRQRMLGERGNGGHGAMRQELIDAYGFDTKFAMHMLRLGFQGVELLTEGKLTQPLRDPVRSYLRGVRLGAETLEACIARSRELEAELKALRDSSSPLRTMPDYRAVEEWMIKTYREAWHD